MDTILKLLKFLARLTGTVVISFILVFVMDHIYEQGDKDFFVLESAKEAFTFLCFPFGLLLGLFISFWKELLGAMISIISGGILLQIRPDLIEADLVLLAFVPSLLYFLYSLIRFIFRITIWNDEIK